MEADNCTKRTMVKVLVGTNLFIRRILLLTFDKKNKYIIRKEKVEHTWLMHREYIIGGVVGFVIGAIIF